jgi:hypothetical protein
MVRAVWYSMYTDSVYTDSMYTDRMYTDSMYTDSMYTDSACDVPAQNDPVSCRAFRRV